MNPLNIKRRHALGLLIAGLASLTSCRGQHGEPELAAILERDDPAKEARLRFDGESRLTHIKQLTFGGENAEAYFSKDGTELIFQSTRDGLGCDQIFRMDVDGRNQRMVSTGQGRTTCGYIFPGSPRIIYSSTHATLKQCPERPDYSKGYVWRLQPELDMYIAGADGQNPQPFLPHPGYDAEAVVSPVGDRVLFTSTRDGDVDIYSANADGSDLRRLTDEVGYDGGAFFSPDGTKIIYRAHHPKTPEALKTYKELLAQNLVRPSVMELFVMDADGSNKRQITSNGAANFAPYFHPSGDRVIFSSNMDDPKGRDFDLYMIGLDGKGLERITFNPSFDSFPMFSADGRRVVFASNRNAKREGETNVFIADWVATLPSPEAARLRGPAEIEAATWSSRAARLSDPKLMGRGLGTPELDQAAKLIATQYEMIGLLPAGDKDQGYMQRFEVPTETTVKAASLKVDELEGQLDADFRPAPFSANASVEGELAFVGYGIRAPSLGYDDYAGIDVKDKIVVVLRHEPGALDPDSKFDGLKPTRHSDLSVKAIIARQRGAKGMLIINDAAHYQAQDGASKHPDELLSMQVQGAHTDVGLPVMHLSWAGAARLLPSLELAKRQQTIDQTQRPASALLKAPKVRLSVELARLKSPAANVIGRLAAREDGAPTERALIIGAHYDHLGMGGASSMRPESKAAHLGADDNASGVATILELAEALKSTKRAHDVYVVAFTGEESGLLGSTYLAQHLPLPKERVLAMMNFDMVGRLKDGQLTVMGVDTAAEFRAWARQAIAQVGLSAQLEGSGYGPSDHMAFTLQQIPVLHFFTGLHADYHTPDDTADKLDAPGAVKITQLAYTLAKMILESPTPPQLVTDASAASPHSGGDNGHSGARAYGPYFGSIPSFGQDPSIKGALIGGVQPGSPAEAAGLKKGDVIVKFGPDEILSMQEYAMSLRKYKPGDEVELVVMREGQQVKLKATLGRKDK